ncbi:hypothetical protein CI109_100805 [Kwoniella shandongensis]|uniref:Uncharacterized protein n=1 Tax=Kwoniella shandongensis TaxID=1734106 RepID=A0A5M6BUT1_9TREE|nr:uncharacterized protein CI109_005016 [Kwoniella shandongensis]KAA5526626.1 hypothetical protein CI109_005016 [Kwoniella shandongensis]
MTRDTDLYASYLALGLQALIPITVGSFKSLKTPAATLRKLRAARRDKLAQDLAYEDDLDLLEEDEETIEETLTWADSLLFPVLGSVALLGLWAILKYVGKKWINLVLGVYFSGAGIFAVQSTFSSIVNFALRQLSIKPKTYHVRISAGIRQIFHLPITLPSLLLLPVSIILPALYIPLGRPYILSNVLALSLSTATLALLKLDSFLTAFSLLGLLLIYDIFWVFATPVMVTVAKGIDAPIKILSPKTSPFSSPTEFAMLGLGDIVVPGLVIALCLRYDLHRHVKSHPEEDVTSRSKFGKGYFIAGLVSYVIGLGTTMVVMHWTKRAQPALLYLSPACTIGPLLLALARGELKDLWAFNDAPSEEEDDKKVILDESIEPPSEIAHQARLAAKEEVEDGTLTPLEENDSWMEGGVVGGGAEEGKPRKRKGGKRK